MNDQEIFDTVARHLLNQNQKAKAADGFCQYRTQDGLKCAVGCLIPDDVYDARIEGSTMHDLSDAVFGEDCDSELSQVLFQLPLHDTLTNLINGRFPLLTSLQGVHDEYEPRQWREKLHSVAVVYSLDPAVLDEFQAPLPIGPEQP